MEIEFHYIRRITGLLAANSKSEATRKVRESGSFNIPVFEDHEAPVAYRRFDKEGSVVAETRWLNGGHWHVTESMPPADGKGMGLDLQDYDLMYGDLVSGGDNIRHGTAFHGYVDGNKKWFRVASDDAPAAYAAAAKHFTENTAVIGGKFAYRVLEPSVQIAIRNLEGKPPLTAFVDHSPRETVARKRWHHKFGLSLHEHIDATEAIIASANLESPVARSRVPLDRFEIVIPEAFSETMVEAAAKKTIEDGISLGEKCMNEFDFRSKVAFTVLRDAISHDGRLLMDSLTALDRFAEFGDVLKEAKMKAGQLQNMLLSYIGVSLRIAGERLEEHRSLERLYASTKPEFDAS